MGVDIEEVLFNFLNTGELPTAESGSLFTDIYRKWVENGGLNHQKKNVRSVSYMKKVLGGTVKSFYQKVSGKIFMGEKDLVAFLALFLREWDCKEAGGPSVPHALFTQGKVGLLAQKLLAGKIRLRAEAGLTDDLSTTVKTNSKEVEVHLKVPVKLLPVTFTFSIASTKDEI